MRPLCPPKTGRILFLATLLLVAGSVMPRKGLAQEVATAATSTNRQYSSGRFWGAFETEIIAQSSPVHKLLFGTDAENYNLQFGWNALSHTDLLFSIGYRQDEGNKLSQLTYTPIANDEILRMMPMSASVRLRLAPESGWWVVPYIRGGVSSVYFKTDSDVDPTAPTIWGFKWGVNGGGGILWRIDYDADARRSLRSDGINGLYLDTGFHWQWIDDFGGTGLNLSGMGGRVGLSLLID